MAGKPDLRQELAKKAGRIKEREQQEAMQGRAMQGAQGEAPQGIGGQGAYRQGMAMQETANNLSTAALQGACPKQGDGITGRLGSPAIRPLRAEEIECRVSTINERGLSLLLFKDARVDQRILDETFTPFGWKRTHQCIDGNLYCTVEIWDGEKGQWIAKQDVGIASHSEKEKGQASDSFKRACFNWGLGRELYTAPFIWVPAGVANIQPKGDRFVTPDRFSVYSIGYSPQREITSLCIINGKGQKVYELKGQPEAGASAEGWMAALERELMRTGVTMEAVLERYGIESPGQITGEIYRKALNSLKKTATQAA